MMLRNNYFFLERTSPAATAITAAAATIPALEVADAEGAFAGASIGASWRDPVQQLRIYGNSVFHTKTMHFSFTTGTYILFYVQISPLDSHFLFLFYYGFSNAINPVLLLYTFHGSAPWSTIH